MREETLLMKTYTTVQGDMWDMIAYKQLGSVSLTDRLMWANRQYLDLYTFPAGITLQIPELETDSTVEGLPPWKRGRSKSDAVQTSPPPVQAQDRQSSAAPTAQEIAAMVRAAVAGALASMPQPSSITNEEIDRITEEVTDELS